MKNFIFWSDIHREFAPFDLPDLAHFQARPDGVLLAGDIDGYGRHIDFARKVNAKYGCPVGLIHGNHEYYGDNIETLLELERRELAVLRAKGHEIYALHGDSVVIAGVRIIGATLWTDFALHSPDTEWAMRYASRGMNDFRVISTSAGGARRRFQPSDALALHRQHKQSILRLLAEPHQGPTIVMTHHMPIREAIHAAYEGDVLNPCFASDLMAEIINLDFDVWIYGHSHRSNEVEVQGSDGRAKRFLSNPRGYPNEYTTFDPLRMITLP